MSKARQLAQKPTQPTGRKNLIINGAMNVAQRGTSAVTANNSYAVDRFINQSVSDGAFSAQQVTDAPSGFTHSLKFTTTTADTSLSGGQYLIAQYRLEGNSTALLGFGSADAKTITLSFYVKSSLTGTFTGSISDSSFAYSYPYSYTINSANTWERKTITISGATSGTWNTDNSIGARVYFSLGDGGNLSGTAGSWVASGKTSATGGTNLLGTLNATFQITGVQLEVGSVGTEFEHRSYGEELALCQRYYVQYPNALDTADATSADNSSSWSAPVCSMYSSTSCLGTIHLPVEMRAVPSVSYSGSIATGSPTNQLAVYSNGDWRNGSSTIFLGNVPSTNHVRIEVRNLSGANSGDAAGFYIYNKDTTNNHLAINAEL